MIFIYNFDKVFGGRSWSFNGVSKVTAFVMGKFKTRELQGVPYFLLDQLL